MLYQACSELFDNPVQYLRSSNYSYSDWKKNSNKTSKFFIVSLYDPMLRAKNP